MFRYAWVMNVSACNNRPQTSVYKSTNLCVDIYIECIYSKDDLKSQSISLVFFKDTIVFVFVLIKLHSFSIELSGFQTITIVFNLNKLNLHVSFLVSRYWKLSEKSYHFETCLKSIRKSIKFLRTSEFGKRWKKYNYDTRENHRFRLLSVYRTGVSNKINFGTCSLSGYMDNFSELFAF